MQYMGRSNQTQDIPRKSQHFPLLPLLFIFNNKKMKSTYVSKVHIIRKVHNKIFITKSYEHVPCRIVFWNLENLHSKLPTLCADINFIWDFRFVYNFSVE